MKCFKVGFSETDIFMQNDQKFVYDFVKLLHKLNHPEKLGLYSQKMRMNEGHSMFVITPKEHSYNVASLLSNYNVCEVSAPKATLLELEIGKDGLIGNL